MKIGIGIKNPKNQKKIGVGKITHMSIQDTPTTTKDLSEKYTN